MNQSKFKIVNMANPNASIKKRGKEAILKSNVPLNKFPKSLGEWLLEWAEKTPDNIFIADKNYSRDEWRKLSYQEFLTKVCSVGQALIDRGLSNFKPVVIVSDNSIDNAILLFGSMHVGIPVVPISPAYSLLSKDYGKLRLILKQIKPGLIFADDGDKFNKALSSVDVGDAELVFSYNPPRDLKYTEFSNLINTPATKAVEDAFSQVGPDTVAKILYTSGSTGEPKGVINTQRMLCSNQVAIQQVWKFLLEKPPVTVDWLPWNHTFGGNHNLNMILANGGSIYIDSGKPVPGLIEKTVTNLKEIAPTIYFNVPRGYDMLLPFLEADKQLSRSFFAELDVIFYAAAALTQSSWDRLVNLSINEIGSKVMMIAGWGATETAPDCTQVHWPIEKAGVIGLPIPGTELKLVEQSGKTEVRVRGPNVTPGYWQNIDLTEQSFDKDGFYRIGDAVKMEDMSNPNKGIIFDGRVAENFKLSSGTWAYVGGIRTNVVSVVSNIIQDAVITGSDREELGLLIFPNILGCRSLCPDEPSDLPITQLLSKPEITNTLTNGIKKYNARFPGSSERIGRALFLFEPPDIDSNEITDKGYINQSAVLSSRSDLVDRLYSKDETVIIFK